MENFVGRIHLVALCACLLLIARAFAEGPAITAPPRIDNIFPPSSAVGAQVTITGSGFGNDPTGNQVVFGGVLATQFKTWTPGAIYVTVPQGAKTGNVEVSVLGVSSNQKMFKVTIPTAQSKSGTCSGDTLSLGALTGKDADALALTLSSIFRGQFVATSCADKSDSSGDQPASSPVAGGASPSSSNHTLQVKTPGGAAAPKCSATRPSRCTLEGLAASLDRDNFKGILNSNYVVKVEGFAARLAQTFPHPTPDIDVEQAADGRGNPSFNYLILVPSGAVLGQTSAVKTFGQDVAGLKRDFEILSKYAPGGGQPRPCPPQPADPTGEKAAELCLAVNTVTLAVLNPRDVLLHAQDLFDARIELPIQIFALNHSIALLPPNNRPDQSAAAVEQYESYQVYQQNQKQTELVASSQPASAAGPSPSAPPVTTTTTTIKMPVGSPSKGAASGDGTSMSAAPTTTSISTSTSTTTTPAVSAPPSTQSAAATPPSGQGTASTPAAPSAPSGSPAGGAAPGAQTASAQTQPTAPSWGIDNIVRLYDYRDGPGISAAINGMVPGGRPIVQPLSDNGANDLIEILPSAAQQGGYTLGDIERAVALIDLPRPQVSLQIWSYQISSKVKEPSKTYTSRKVTAEKDEARMALESINKKVDLTNQNMTTALARGMETIFEEARRSTYNDSFFDRNFREYLTWKYHDCILNNHYCLGYFKALEYPDQNSNRKVIGASLGRLVLFLAAATDPEAKALVGRIIGNMESEMPSVHTEFSCFSQPPAGTLARFRSQLERITDPGNLHLLRAAFLDFFFNYKWTLSYPNDFVPYDLRHSAHALDDLLLPIDNAFDQDIDDYVQDQLDDDPCLIPKTSKVGFINQGIVSVAALSGTPAMVSAQISNYFNTTQTPALSQVAQNLLAPPGTSSTGGSPGLQGLVSTNPYVVAGEALAGILAPPKLTAQVTRGITLVVTPTSLDTASSAELNVNFIANEPDGAPQSVNTTAVTEDLLDRVASHLVTDTVRVQSLKLFYLSTIEMEITHPQTPTCLPLADDGFWRAASYVAAVPFSVPCAVWRSTFGSMPVAGRLFEWPRFPVTVDNRSVAIIRAVVVPTAMDFGEALDFESDRVKDPVTGLTESLSSINQLGWRARQFHRLMMQCVVNSSTPGCSARLSEIPDDLRKPSTN